MISSLDTAASLRDTIRLFHEKGSKMSELAKMLMVGFHLLAGDATAEHLAEQVQVSPATLKRYVLELRHMGAVIVSRREGSAWLYRIENAEAVQSRLCSWLDHEISRTLI